MGPTAGDDSAMLTGPVDLSAFLPPGSSHQLVYCTFSAGSVGGGWAVAGGGVDRPFWTDARPN
jgi:hypothetical protein